MMPIAPGNFYGIAHRNIIALIFSKGQSIWWELDADVACFETDHHIVDVGTTASAANIAVEEDPQITISVDPFNGT